MENGMIEKYLDEEGFVDRSRVNAIDVLGGIWGIDGKKWIRGVFKGMTQGDFSQRRIYNKFGKLAGQIAAYDILKSHCRDGIIYIIEQAIEQGFTNPTNRVLDIGCGTGLEACFFAEQMGSRSFVAGLDIAQEMIMRAQERKVRRNLSNAHFLIGSRDELPYENKSFDLIFSNHALSEGNTECYDQYEEIINRQIIAQRLIEFKRVLKDDGRMLISEPSQPEGVDYTRDYTKSLIEFKGLKIEDIRVKSFPPPVDDHPYSEVCFIVRK